MRSLKLILSLTIGVIRDPQMRRQFMFYGLLVALVQIFLGVTFLEAPLRQHPWILVGFWSACAWLTIASVLLALYDMVAVRATSRRERRRLEEEYIRKQNPPDDENAP